MKFVSANVVEPLPIVESFTVEFTAAESDTVISALQMYARNSSYYDVAAENLASDLQRAQTEAVHATQLDRICSSGVFDENLRAAKKITAIKHLRAMTDCGLAVAKHAVDRRQEALGF